MPQSQGDLTAQWTRKEITAGRWECLLGVDQWRGRFFMSDCQQQGGFAHLEFRRQSAHPVSRERFRCSVVLTVSARRCLCEYGGRGD